MTPFQLLAAPFTPFDANGALQLDIIEKQVERLRHDDVNGAFVCGTTGEGASLTVAERKAVATRWREAAAELRLIIHVGHTVLADARELAEHAATLGVEGIAATAPFYFKTTTAAATVEWCAHIAAAAPDLKFYYYHIPSMTGVDFPVAEFVVLAQERIPSFGGLKFTHEKLADYGLCLDRAREAECFYGRDENLLAALALGARSAVGSTYNFAAPLYRRLIAAFERGDWENARREQARARAFINIAVRHGGTPAMKVMMNFYGLDCGPCRPPLPKLSTEQQMTLRAELNSIGFFEWIRA